MLEKWKELTAEYWKTKRLEGYLEISTILYFLNSINILSSNLAHTHLISEKISATREPCQDEGREEPRDTECTAVKTSRASPSQLSGGWLVVEESRGSPASSTRRPGESSRLVFLSSRPSAPIQFLIRTLSQVFLENVIHDAVTYTEHAKRKTLTAMDVVLALKRQGRTLYGFGG